MGVGSNAVASSSVKILTWVVYRPPQGLPSMSNPSAHLVPEGGLLSSTSPHPSQMMVGQLFSSSLLSSGVFISLSAPDLMFATKKPTTPGKVSSNIPQEPNKHIPKE